MRALVLSLLLAFGFHTLAPLSAQEPLCPSFDSSSGIGSVVGQVVDEDTGTALGFAMVRLSALGGGGVFETRADPSGHFSFCGVPAGFVTLSGEMGQLTGILGPSRLEVGQQFEVHLRLSPKTVTSNSGTLTGIVLDSGSGDPVEGATVVLTDEGQTEITNENGRFTFPSLPAGEHEMLVTMLGYADVSGTVNILYARTISTEVSLSTEPIRLSPIEVTAVRRRIILPGLEDLERRINNGWGRFVLEEEIQRRNPSKLSQVLAETGVEMRANDHALFMRRTGCAPLVYIDDVKVTHMARSRSVLSGGPGLLSAAGGGLRPPGVKPPTPNNAGAAGEAADAVNNIVHPQDVVAVEVYRGPAEIPGQYLDSNAQCGVILIWTRRGNISGR